MKHLIRNLWLTQKQMDEYRKRDRAFMEGEKWNKGTWTPQLSGTASYNNTQRFNVIKQYGDIVEYRDFIKMEMAKPGEVVKYTLPPSTWRRFTMWFTKARALRLANAEVKISHLEQEIKYLKADVGGGASASSFGLWCPDSLHTKYIQLRRDLDLLLKKHKLCVKHNKADVTLVKCSK